MPALWILSGCNDLTPEPTTGNYPVGLEASMDNAVVQLNWTLATISTFEEYIVLRSTEPIPDNPIPDAGGTIVLIARIDERTKTTFEDSEFPLEQTMYYKVYADIGERFLESATVRVDISFTFFPFRSDIGTYDPVTGNLIGFDNNARTLFEYSIEDQTVIRSNPINDHTTILRYGNYLGEDEIYASSNNHNIIRVYDRNTMALKTTLTTGFNVFTDFQYAENKFFITTRNMLPAFLVMSRSGGQTLATAGTIQQYEHKALVDKTGSDLVVYDVGTTNVDRYKIASNGTILETVTKNLNPSGNLAIPDLKPDGSQIVLTNQGNIIGTSTLEERTVLDSDNNFFIDIAFGEDDQTVAACFNRFDIITTSHVVRIFDTENYDLLSTSKLPFPANMIFSHNHAYYTTSVVFFDNQLGTILVEVYNQ
jgi:hypothetical protein